MTDDRSTDPDDTNSMTDTRSETENPEARNDPPSSEETEPRFARLSSADLRGLLDRIGLAALVLLAVIAGWSFYSQAGRAIRTWLDPAYQPIALAAFNLAVLFVALAGVTHQLYRIRAGDQGDAPSETGRVSEE
ncbi:MAG: hypothetical protein A07HR67_01169 [uncultured archaeon A07HR67]|jgi:hypothetical protein|nr:MAG: hypothetical protein A07HR67_01169 [uncultured archaeon A07HR67]